MTGRACRIAAQSLEITSKTSATICGTVTADLLVDEADRVYSDAQVAEVTLLSRRFNRRVNEVLAPKIETESPPDPT